MKIDLAALFNVNEDMDEGILRTLLKAMKGVYSNEFDYLSFKQSIKNLQQLDMDEATSFKSAYATATTMGITKEKILRSANQYQNALSNEKTSFAEALKNQLEVKVNGKKGEAALLKNKIEEYNRKIEEMKKDISIFQEKIDKVDEHMANAKTKILETKTKFESTYSTLEKTITSDIKQIEKHL